MKDVDIARIVATANSDSLGDWEADGLGDEGHAGRPGGPDGRPRGERSPGSASPHHATRVDWASMWAADPVDSDFMIDPILPRHRATAIVAPGKSGKSLLALAASAATATGRPFLHSPAREPCTVLYVDMEMTLNDLHERMGDLGYGPDDDLSRFHYQLHSMLPPLDTAQGGGELLGYAREIGAELVTIDTTARVLSGPENDADTIRHFYRHTGQPLKAAGITTLRLDNTGKDPSKGGRGTSAKVDDIDVVWQVTRGEHSLDLKATHRRVAWVPETVSLAVTADPLGYRVAPRSWPIGTTDAARKLDDVGVPLNIGRDRAREKLKTAGLPCSNEALTAALKWRREQHGSEGR